VKVELEFLEFRKGVSRFWSEIFHGFGGDGVIFVVYSRSSRLKQSTPYNFIALIGKNEYLHFLHHFYKLRSSFFCFKFRNYYLQANAYFFISKEWILIKE
jgi:hypothetical protein